MNIIVYYHKTIEVLRGVITTALNKIQLKLSGVVVGENFHTYGLLYIRNGIGGCIRMGRNVNITSCRQKNPTGSQIKTTLFTWKGAQIIIGNDVGISNTTMIATKSIVLEDRVCIGGGTRIYDTDHHSVIPEYRLNGNTHVCSAPVLLKEECFVGSDCIILKGVTIGRRSVVGAGSVVTKSIPDDEIWAGNPAHFVKKMPVVEAVK